jgi:hypothetical protein
MVHLVPVAPAPASSEFSRVPGNRTISNIKMGKEEENRMLMNEIAALARKLLYFYIKYLLSNYIIIIIPNVVARRPCPAVYA